MKKLLLLAFICFSVVHAFSQSRRITGTVTGDGSPLSGATITIKGTQRSVVSDANGGFSIDVAGSNARTLVITYVGFQTTG